jgi:hypothetical protein
LFLNASLSLQKEDQGDPKLYEIAVQAQECGRISHTLEAEAPQQNRQVGSDLAKIVNQSAKTYSHAHGHLPGNETLYGRAGTTVCRIVYEQDGEYWDIEY